VSLRELGDSFSAEADKVGRKDWARIISNFGDANIYQTYAYGSVRWGEKNLSHLLLKRSNAIVAAAQVRIFKLPYLKRGIAYLPWGPMFKVRQENHCPETFRQIVRALRNEYAVKRKLLIRATPNIIDEDSESFRSILNDEGFKWCQKISGHKTIILDLQPSLPELLMGLKKKWRENLRRAEKSNLRIRQGQDSQCYDVFINLYREMHARKKFQQFVDIDEFKRIQNELEDHLKLNIMLAEHNGNPLAALVWSMIGNTGVPIFSATGDDGMKSRASYLLRWRMLELLKENGSLYLDQGGLDPQKNPGGYHFKVGMGGSPVSFIGQFESCENAVSYSIVNLGDAILLNYRKLRSYIGRRFKADPASTEN
jgi:lipid II:glycine glycyltransferase (peptidoglycan interpeptide bridge formation enzyme)